MEKKKKNKEHRKYFILAIGLYFIGMLLGMSTMDFMEFNLSKLTTILFIIIAVIFLITAVLALTKAISKLLTSDEEGKIEEYDERNVMIRGKTAEMNNMISAFITTGIMLVCIFMGYNIPALILGVSLILGNIIHAFIFAYYSKKY